MHNRIRKNSLAPVTATTEKPPQPSRPELNGISGRASGHAVIALPPNRDQLSADLRSINNQFFLMLCELHQGILVNLLHVPTRILVAAENLVRPMDAEDWSRLWSETLVLYVEALTDGRKQILAATRLHGLAEQGRSASGAINSIEDALPSILQAVSQPSKNHSNLASTAAKLSSPARTLDKILTDLLVTVEHAIERAKTHDIANRPGSLHRNP